MYWRRRAVLVLVLVVVMGLVAFALSRGGGDDAAAAGPVPSATETTRADPTDDPTADPDDEGAADEPAEGTASPTEAADAATAEPCTGDQLQVVATADAGTYPAGTTPQLGVTVRNTGTAACSVDLGAAGVELLVVSGADRIWSSDDCEADPATSVVGLDAGAEESSVTGWPRQRSVEGCGEGLAEPRPGTYQLTATVAGTTSAPVSFTLQ